MKKTHTPLWRYIAIIFGVVSILGGSLPVSLAGSDKPQAPYSRQVDDECLVDLMLLVDGSNLVTDTEFQAIVAFAHEMVTNFITPDSQNNLGIVQFAESTILHIGLSDNAEIIHRVIDNDLLQLKTSKNLVSGMGLAQGRLALGREEVPNIMLIVNKSAALGGNNPIETANALRDAGTEIWIVALGADDLSQINLVADGEEHVFVVDDAEAFDGLPEVILNRFCNPDLAPEITATPTLSPSPSPTATLTGSPAPTRAIVSATPQVSAVASERPSQIAFASDRDGDLEIYLMNADGSDIRQLTFNAATDDMPAFSPDGKKIAFVSNIDGDFEIFTINRDSSELRQVTVNNVDDLGPVWSPDGSKIAYYSALDGDFEIYIMDADGRNSQQVTFNALAADRSPTWSPDGESLIYYSDITGGRELYVIHLETTVTSRLTENEFYDGMPAWSPDGLQVAFRSTRDDGDTEIYVLSLEDGRQTRLTTRLGFDDDPVWSPDGTEILYISDQGGNVGLWVMAADGSNSRVLLNDEWLNWSPDWAWLPE